MVRLSSSHGRSPLQNWISRSVPTRRVNCAVQARVAAFLPSPGAIDVTLRANTCVNVNSYRILKYLLRAQVRVLRFSVVHLTIQLLLFRLKSKSMSTTAAVALLLAIASPAAAQFRRIGPSLPDTSPFLGGVPTGT